MKLQQSALEEGIFLPLLCIGAAIILMIADYFAGPFVQFPITYLIPISLASWYLGRSWGLILSIVMPLVRFFFNIALWTVPWTIVEASVNCVIRIVVFSLFAVLVHRTAKQTLELSKEVNMLSGLLPICAYCKKIRDESNEWMAVEQYITQRSDASFTHGVCPECAKKHFGQYLKDKTY
jgi:K+-sensing histidine kinase KdpD